MRVLFLAPQPFHEVRGTPLAVAAFARALGELGHDVDLLTFPQGEAWSAPRVTHLRSLSLTSSRIRPGFSSAKAAQDIPFGLRAIRLARSGRYDVVHAVEESAALVAPFVPGSARFVVDLDSDLREQLANSSSIAARAIGPIAGFMHDRSLRRADLAIVINAKLEDAVRRVRPDLPVHRIEDPPLVSAVTEMDRADAARLRTELAIGDAPVVLYTGNFEPYQGVELLLKAAGQSKKPVFVIVGGEAEEISRLRTNLPKETAARIRFVGKKPPSMLPQFMALADVLVSPRSLGGNTPFKIYTYLASGKPIVATRLDTHTQVLSDETAFLADPTPEGLAAGIETAISDRAAAERRAANGLALIEREYSTARYKQKVAAAYAALKA